MIQIIDLVRMRHAADKVADRLLVPTAKGHEAARQLQQQALLRGCLEALWLCGYPLVE
jgi:hypothetical protein